MLIKKERLPIKQIVLIGILPSFLKKILYRIKGYKIGRNVSIGIGSVIIGEKVFINNNTKIGFLSVIRAKEIRIERFVRIGSMVYIDTEKVFIDDDARINENVIIGGIKFPDSYLKLGKRTIIMEYSFINPTKPIIIGDDTGIGGHCLLFTHGSWLPQIDGYPVMFAPITLGNKVWLPWRVFIMPGVTVGDNVVIGANSLVTKSIPSNCLSAGSPATILKENYPPPLEKEKRNLIISSIFKDFETYLQHYSYTVNINKGLDENIIEISKNGKLYRMKYLQNCEREKSVNDPQYDLIIIDDAEFKIVKSEVKCKMIIDYNKKERLGSSDLGEEFVSFISRYGIRFNRLD